MANSDDGRRVELYRLYHIGKGGGIEAVSIVESAELAEATSRAEELLETPSGELWLDDAMVSAVRRRA